MVADQVAAVLDGLDSVRGWQEDFYRDLHAHPELSHQETPYRGARRGPAARSRAARCMSSVGGTGVVGMLRNGDGPTVLLRADMDALPVREETGPAVRQHARPLPTATAEVPVMHACGHDVHVTCLLGAVALMAQAREHWSGTLVAVFQPAEETADGAQGDARARAWRPSSATSTWPWHSTCCRCRPGTSAPGSGRPCRPPTACGSPCTDAAPTAPCPRPRSTRWCWPP